MTNEEPHCALTLLMADTISVEFSVVASLDARWLKSKLEHLEHEGVDVDGMLLCQPKSTITKPQEALTTRQRAVTKGKDRPVSR